MKNKKVGANEVCPCGSGLKRKKCHCVHSVGLQELWRSSVFEIAAKEGLDVQIPQIFYTLLRFISETNWNGACHGTSAVLYVIYSELGYKPRLCTGMVNAGIWSCGHSWIEMEGEIYDVSCYFPNSGSPRRMPVFHGKQLDTMANSEVLYGVSMPQLDEGVKVVSAKATFAGIMAEKYPTLMNANLWQVMDNICMLANVNIFDVVGGVIDARALREKYKDTRWELCKSHPQ
ncbi:MAG: hypothetical protein FWH07_07690 [Oscillospiraceae bacterium]|nr:hypothetical protein [Oscillospiraceae bacterium]